MQTLSTQILDIWKEGVFIIPFSNFAFVVSSFFLLWTPSQSHLSQRQETKLFKIWTGKNHSIGGHLEGAISTKICCLFVVESWLKPGLALFVCLSSWARVHTHINAYTDLRPVRLDGVCVLTSIKSRRAQVHVNRTPTQSTNNSANEKAILIKISECKEKQGRFAWCQRDCVMTNFVLFH